MRADFGGTAERAEPSTKPIKTHIGHMKIICQLCAIRFETLQPDDNILGIAAEGAPFKEQTAVYSAHPCQVSGKSTGVSGTREGLLLWVPVLGLFVPDHPPSSAIAPRRGLEVRLQRPPVRS